MQQAVQAYGNVAKQTSTPRELEASLLLKAAAHFQAISEGWERGNRRPELQDDTPVQPMKLWTIFLTSVTSSRSQLPTEIRQNVANLGLFVLNQTIAVTSDPKPEGLGSLININRQIAAGLLGRALTVPRAARRTEIATNGSAETPSPSARVLMAAEVYKIALPAETKDNSQGWS